MSQYNSSMFSDAVYLFSVTYGLWLPMAFPNAGVNQKKLAEQVVLAAFAYLYNKKLIDIVLEERKSFFIKKKTAKVKKLQSSAPDTSGLEAIIFSYILDNSDIYGITRALRRGSNPWREVLQIVKWNLLNRGMLKQVVQGKVLFITTYKYVVNGDISKAENQITELKKTLEELQSKGELYEIILSAIENGLALDTD